jgi:hypothetical protein
VHLDELDQILDSKVGERHDAIFANTLDPDNAILDFHFIGNVVQPVLVFTQVLGDASDGRDVMDLIDVHDQAARARIADAGGVQFHGSN